MAAKKTVAKKAAPPAKKKPAAVKKAASPAKKKPAAVKKAASTAKKKPAAVKKAAAPAKRQTSSLQENIIKDLQELMGTDKHQSGISLLPEAFMDEVISLITDMRNEFQLMSENNLTARQRRRKIGAGVRNYGFIDKASDLAEANPQYAQFFTIADLKNCIRNIETCRELALLLQSFVRAVTNTMLVYATDASLMARDYYHTVKRQADRGDPVAMELERSLRTFFHRSKSLSGEPTILESERDAHALLTHKKEGRIVIEGRRPVIKGGVTKVIDDVHKSKGSFKETEEGSFDD